VKNLITTLILCFGVLLPNIFAQTSPNFTFDQKKIIITKYKPNVMGITVFKDHIPEEKISKATPVLGKVIIAQEKLQFIPLIPFGWGQKYTLVYNNIIEYFTLTIPEHYEFLKVTNVYPSSERIPSNILKWYIKFSKPINTTLIYKYIHFIQASGDTLSRAILPLENALISDNNTLLTVWIEPGRQKRGLGPNEQLGSVFSTNQNYQLRISRELKDQQGVSMLQYFRHRFLIKEADRIQPNINNWNIRIPNINTISSLLIECNESLDYGSSLNNIQIVDKDHKEILGQWQLTDEEKTISFTPSKIWKKGNYYILFNPNIEDLSGNNLYRLFDNEVHNVSSKTERQISYTLTFTIN